MTYDDYRLDQKMDLDHLVRLLNLAKELEGGEKRALLEAIILYIEG